MVDAKSTILGYCIEYSFETRKKWLIELCGIELSSKCLISINLYGIVPTQHFEAYLLVKKGSSKFLHEGHWGGCWI
jgi:hypothetical protein